jgi:hypothetical protein
MAGESALAAALGGAAMPYLVGGQAALGLGQALFSGTQKAKKEYEAKLGQTPQYTGGSGIMDYYNKAYQRASVLPSELASYKTQMQNIGESTAQGLGALAGRRSALAGVGSIIRGQQQAQQQAVVAGEAEQSRRFGQMGSAAQMKTGEETKRYQYNALNPYLRQLQASEQKLAAAQARKDAGIQNIIGAGSLAAMGSLSGKTGGGTDKLKDITGTAKTLKDITTTPLQKSIATNNAITGTNLGSYSEYKSPEFKSFQQTMMPTTLTGKTTIPGYKAYNNQYLKSLRGF